MAIKLKDIPQGQLNPEEVEALSNKTFDYADKERVSMREAQRRIKEQVNDDFNRRQLMRAGEFEEAWKIPRSEPPFVLESRDERGDFTFREKAFEVGKAVHRGLGSIVKLPGIALKAIGEQALTRAEIEELKKSPHAIQRMRARTMETPIGKGARFFANMLRKAGNRYIEVVNGMMIDESPESRDVRAQAFKEAPVFRTLSAVGESAPTYGLAIASTLTSGNPNIGLWVLGTTTAGSSYESLRQQGVDPDLALVGASLEGSIEMITEKVPMDLLMKGAGRPLLIRALSVGSAESFQELFAQLGQNYVSAVVKDVDPEDLSTVLEAAQQEWSIIHQGWEDAMAAGFLMGAGGGAFVSDTGLPPTDFGLRTAEEIRAEYGFVPRNVNEIISLTDQIKQRVKDVTKEAKPVAEVEVPAPEPDAIKDVAEKFGISEERAKAILDRQAEFQKEKAEKPPVEPTVEVEAKEITEKTDAELLDQRQPLKDIELTKRTPQQIKELNEVEDELVSRHEPETTDISKKTRQKAVKETAEAIISDDIYQSALESQEIQGEQVGAGGLVFVNKSGKGEVEAAIQNHPQLRFHITFDKSKSSSSWDQVAQEGLERGKEGEVADMGLDEFLEQFGKALESRGQTGGVNLAALQEAIDIQEFTFLEVLDIKYDMLRKGFHAADINDTIKQWVIDNEVDIESVEGEYLPIEGKRDVKSKQEILRGLEKAHRKTQRKPQAAEKRTSKEITVAPEVKQPAEKVEVPREIIPTKEIGEGEEKPRGTSVSVMAQAIEDEIVEENKEIFDEIPTYRAMNMKEQAEKALALIESDVEQAKRIAFYQEPAPPDLFPENVFSALRTYAKMTLDIDLIMDLALKEDVVREHTIMGKRIKSLDTDQDYGDPVRAIREVVQTRLEQKVRRGEDVSALEVKLRELQAELDKVTKERADFTKRADRAYGRRNKLVPRTEYDSIMARRKKEAGGFAGRAGGVAFVPNAQDFADVAKIATFHLEAMGRDFAKWSHQMTRDFGDWITPHLRDEYEKAIAEAKKAGVEIKESKRLTTKKKRLATTTGKIETKLEELDLAKVPRIPIELDEEGQRLQDAFDAAREKLKAAQAVANIITEKEVRIIAQLSKDAAERKAVMEKSKRRNNLIGEGATQTELEYGTAISLFLEYVNDLKVEANKRTMGEVIRNYLKNPVDFISDFAGTLKAAKASLDNSFHLRQGLPTFLKAITGHVPSAKIWWKTFIKSWKIMWQTLRKRKVMRGLFAEMISDPDYDLLKKSKVALNVIEEEIPVDIPSRIPLLGILFRMGENAFVGSSRYMRYQLAKQYLNVWRKSGVELNKRELESIGRLANSQTGRGESAARSQKPGLLNNVFWSPRNLRAYIDILTVHMFDRNISAFARKQAALNLIRYVSGAAMILALAKWIDDDSVTWDTNSSDFGKIRVGDTRFSVGGGMAILVILASRIVSRKFTSSTTGITKSIDTRKFGALGGKDLVFNFLENKLSPAAGLTLSIIDQKTWDGNQLTIPQMVNDALTPLIVQNIFETGSADDSANVLAALMAETMGVNVQTFSGGRKKQKSNKRTKL